MTGKGTAFVTGGAGGIGAEIVRRLATDGYDLVVADRDGALAAKVAESVGGRSVAVDIADPASVDEVFKSVGDGLDILVNAAGIHLQKLVVDTEPEEWDRIQSVNTRGPFLTCRAAAKIMMRAERGRIVNIITRLNFGNPYSSAYIASKNALWGLTQCLAVELASYGITVNGVAPGHVGPGTGMEKQFREKADKLGMTWDAFEAQVLKTIPIGRWCRPADVAAAVSYVVSPEASFVTGELINVTGGFVGYGIAPPKEERFFRGGVFLSKDLRNGGLDRLTIDDIVKPGFSTPWDAPTVPPYPFTFRNVEVLTLVWRTTEAAIARLLPPPLVPTSDVVLAHIYKMNDTDWLGPYGESNISIGCRLPGIVEGSYSPYLFLSSDVGVVHGREMHGQPKKLGEPKLEMRGDLVVGTVARNGIDIFTGTMPYKQRTDTLASLTRHFDFAENVNLKVIDHIDQRPAIRQLTARRLADVTVHECWGGPCTVELRPNAQAPVHRLPVVDMLDGLHWRADFTLVPGRIVHDYLA